MATLARPTTAPRWGAAYCHQPPQPFHHVSGDWAGDEVGCCGCGGGGGGCFSYLATGKRVVGHRPAAWRAHQRGQPLHYGWSCPPGGRWEGPGPGWARPRAQWWHRSRPVRRRRRSSAWGYIDYFAKGVYDSRGGPAAVPGPPRRLAFPDPGGRPVSKAPRIPGPTNLAWSLRGKKKMYVCR